MNPNNEAWLEEVHPLHQRLTKTVIPITESLLIERKIDFLTISGRTKDKKSALEKIIRKSYTEPAQQLTDISGIRIIVYLESDLQKVSQLIRSTFEVDEKKSLDKDTLLSTDRIGYRSLHFVCNLGTSRGQFEEYKGLECLKFEFQVRTVLQHAWAELSHDRKYKFSGVLAHDLERKLNLYAGLLEIADKGFSETASAIDKYTQKLEQQTDMGELNIEITSLSLKSYISKWCKDNKIQLKPTAKSSDLEDLIAELNQFGIETLSQLKDIIPNNYVEITNQKRHRTTIYGLIRDWMLISDWEKFTREVKFNWVMDENDFLPEFFTPEEFRKFKKFFTWVYPNDYDDLEK
jgi:ppGpp synthetase/RelA/SpoT-type nucleotidyltranferase